jgi:flagellar L-ring protein precursor FlgH
MKTVNLGWLVLLPLALSGCQELARPQLSAPGSGLSLNTPPFPTPVALMAPPRPSAGSLWVPGSRQFFKDSRAHSVGDILTVMVEETASAKTNAKTDAKRENTEESTLTNLLNLEGKLRERGIPLVANNLLDIDSNRNFKGDAKTNRSDSLNASIAAVVTQVLPNGLLVIQGQREVLVNYEKQMLTLQGMVRPEDISAQNTIPSSKIAEARIAYAGSGNVDEAQSAQYGNRLLNKILPF